MRTSVGKWPNVTLGFAHFLQNFQKCRLMNFTILNETLTEVSINSFNFSKMAWASSSNFNVIKSPDDSLQTQQIFDIFVCSWLDCCGDTKQAFRKVNKYTVMLVNV